MTIPTLLVDCDGVLADFSRHLLCTLGSDRTPSDVSRWDIFSLLGEWHGPEMTRRAISVMDDEHFWSTLPVIEGARESLDALRHAYRVVCVTIPWPSCRGWTHARTDWLRQLGFNARDIVYTADKSLARGHVMIDDRPEYLEVWRYSNPGRSTFLYATPYNEDAVEHIRVSGWSDLLDRLLPSKEKP